MNYVARRIALLVIFAFFSQETVSAKTTEDIYYHQSMVRLHLKFGANAAPVFTGLPQNIDPFTIIYPLSEMKVVGYIRRQNIEDGYCEADSFRCRYRFGAFVDDKNYGFDLGQFRFVTSDSGPLLSLKLASEEGLDLNFVFSLPENSVKLSPPLGEYGSNIYTLAAGTFPISNLAGYSNYGFDSGRLSVAPEPSAWLLLGTGFALLGGAVRRNGYRNSAAIKSFVL